MRLIGRSRNFRLRTSFNMPLRFTLRVKLYKSAAPASPSRFRDSIAMENSVAQRLLFRQGDAKLFARNFVNTFNGKGDCA